MPEVDAAAATAQPTTGTETTTAASTTAAQPSTAKPDATTQPGTTTPAAATSRPSWVAPPRERWTELRESERTARDQITRLQADLDARDRRIRALAGVDPVDPNAVEDQQLQQAFFQKFPQFRLFQDPRVLSRLESLLAKSDELEAGVNYQWDRLSQRTLRSLTTQAQETIGVDTLDDQQTALLHAAFASLAKADPETFRTRYEAEDPTLIEDCLKLITRTFLDPARRSAAAGVVRGQPRVPSGGSSRPVITAPPKIDYSDPEAVENAAVNYLKERGHLQDA